MLEGRAGIAVSAAKNAPHTALHAVIAGVAAGCDEVEEGRVMWPAWPA